MEWVEFHNIACLCVFYVQSSFNLLWNCPCCSYKSPKTLGTSRLHASTYILLLFSCPLKGHARNTYQELRCVGVQTPLHEFCWSNMLNSDSRAVHFSHYTSRIQVLAEFVCLLAFAPLCKIELTIPVDFARLFIRLLPFMACHNCLVLTHWYCSLHEVNIMKLRHKFYCCRRGVQLIEGLENRWIK